MDKKGRLGNRGWLTCWMPLAEHALGSSIIRSSSHFEIDMIYLGHEKENQS